jgi:RNA polymerase sigma factor (sigma-70 family)
MDFIESKYDKIARNISLPTPERERELSNVIINKIGSERDMAICELVNGNMRLVLNLTKKYKRMPDYADTLFDGNLGLIKAALTYDANKGRFSTWATPKIKTEVRNGLLSRLRSPLSVSRYASELAFKINDIQPDKNGDLVLPDVPSAKLAMMGIMDGIPLYNEEGEVNDIVDSNMRSAFEEVQINDLIELINKATTELGLTEDEILLVSESNIKSNQESFAPIMAQKLNTSPSNVRMLRAKLLWKIRRKILEYIGKKEYAMISELGKLPEKNWR